MADWMEELERLAELRDKGLISDEEFEVKRQEIINISSEKEIPEEKHTEVEKKPEPAANKSTSEFESSKLINKEFGYDLKAKPSSGIITTPKKKNNPKGLLIGLLVVIVAVIIGIAVSRGGNSSSGACNDQQNNPQVAVNEVSKYLRVTSENFTLVLTGTPLSELANPRPRESFNAFYETQVPYCDPATQALFSDIIDDLNLVLEQIRSSEELVNALIDRQQATAQSWITRLDYLIDGTSNSICVFAEKLDLTVGSFIRERSDIC